MRKVCIVTGYSLKNAKKLGWGSVTGSLNPERVTHLDKYLVGTRVLDAGCAGGAYAEMLIHKGLHVTGIDSNKPFIQLARERKPDGMWVQGDLAALPFSSKTFDCTYCFDVLEHLNDRSAIHELARVTTRRLILAVPQEDEWMARYNLTFLHYRDRTHLRNYTDDSLRELISTIKYTSLIVFPELAIPLKALVEELVEFKLGILARIEFKLQAVKMRLEWMLDPGNTTAEALERKARGVFLDAQKFKTIYTGIVAIVDL